MYYDSWARSTKTRIETEFGFCTHLLILDIREQDPLKQGLKPSIDGGKCFFNSIREQDPLKQGLKRATPCSPIFSFCIREQDPLKQGLKPHICKIKRQNNIHSWARSTKTRIETGSATLAIDPAFIREQDPLKQGLKQHKKWIAVKNSEIREQDPLKQGLKQRIWKHH